MISPPPPLPILKALADPTRLALVETLARGSLNVSELCFVLDQGQSTVSRHLRILLDAGVLALRKEGREAFYRLANDPPAPLVAETLACLGEQRSAEREARLAEIWERRRHRSRAFFDAVAPAAGGPGRADYLGSPDCVPLLLERLGSGGVVADVGTGTGRLLPELGARATRIIAVDGSQAMLDRARDAAALAGAAVDLRLGDIEHLPLADSEADQALAHMVLHHAPDPARTLAELARVVAPGGKILVGDFLPHGNQWMRDELADQWLGLSEHDMRAWLAAAGLAEITFEGVESEASSMGVFVATATKPGSPGTRNTP